MKHARITKREQNFIEHNMHKYKYKSTIKNTDTYDKNIWYNGNSSVQLYTLLLITTFSQTCKFLARNILHQKIVKSIG